MPDQSQPNRIDGLHFCHNPTKYLHPLDRHVRKCIRACIHTHQATNNTKTHYYRKYRWNFICLIHTICMANR